MEDVSLKQGFLAFLGCGPFEEKRTHSIQKRRMYMKVKITYNFKELINL